MSDASTIEWTDATWNPVRGCTKVSAGCKHCYAERFAERWRGIPGHPFEQGFDVRLVPEALELPLRWRKPRRVFVNSMSDLFHEAVPAPFIERVFSAMSRAPQHVFQVLTKRPKRMREHLSAWMRPPLPNVWLGVSVEDQAAADERIPELLATPAALRFLSCEPLLGPVDLTKGRRGPTPDDIIRWVIVGGESGPGARPCDLAWIRSLVQQCRAAHVPAFVKQLGAAASDPPNGLAGASLRVPEEAAELVSHRLRDRKGGDPAEWPADLRVREMPLAPTTEAPPHDDWESL